MALVVQKYGGSSVSDAERIRRVAERIVETKRAGNDVVVVASAMGDTTDELLDLAERVNPDPPQREMDMLLTSGERISNALLAMAISSLGEDAQSFTGSQAGVITTSSHGKAKIIDVTPGRVRSALDEGKVVLVAGFQGVSQDTKDVTTLGRGGSDTTAVALAASLDADVCEIYTDVTGVFTADPRIEPAARRLPLVSHEEMLEAAANGSKVLALRSVEFASNHNVPVHVRSSFALDEGTWITEETPDMEKAIVSMIAHKSDEAKVTLTAVPDQMGVAAAIFTALADKVINVDMIIQNVSQQGFTDVSFTVPLTELRKTIEVMNDLKDQLRYKEMTTDDQIGTVTLVGAGMKSEPGVAAKMFRVLAAEGINLQMIDTSTIRITVVIDRREIERAVRALHDAFDLSNEAERRTHV